MNGIDVLGVVLGTIAIICGMLFLPILFVNLIDHIIESIRKNKHPEYFEFYDAAVYESFRVGGKLNEEKRRIEYYVKLYTNGYRDGECTAEDITKRMAQLTQRWINACDDYKQEQKNIKVLLQKADAYAKEHNLKWGVIYET
jgi:hypothetical protein